MKYPQLISMPSAVSDWLEEQLEARGIDAVVYTRYVLSLLYRDPIDVICPDQDLQFTQPNKEVRRSGGGRKRFRRSSGWWSHELSDAEKLKRSAAVECLMSASDQTCGIESLVDELCEKLKEINSNSSKNSVEQPLDKSTEKREIPSPQDPAKRYYAAFPPLSRNSSGNSPSFITFIPKWFGSPKKRISRKQNRSSSYEEKLHSKVELENMKARSVGKQRFNYFSRNKKDINYCRNVTKSMERSESMNEWELYMFNNNSVKSKRSAASWPQVKDVKLEEVNNEDSLKQAVINAEDSWKSAGDDNLNMYDDLPVDIRELLDSPNPQDDAVELMNLANMRDTGNKTFIQCGTNIISSIWSNDTAMDDATSIYDNTYNTVLHENSTESFLDLKFSSISIDNKLSSKWLNTDTIAENETNLYFEHFHKSLTGNNNDNLDNCCSIPWSITTNEKFEKWSDVENYENESQTNDTSRSLLILNHSKESSFTEVIPRPARAVTNAFGRNTNALKSVNENSRKNVEPEKENEDDLLHSVHSHFKPINEKFEAKNQGHYVDGTTFVIPSNFDKVVYKRSESGFMYLDPEKNTPKKYLEYRNTSSDAQFSIKFGVCQNDKACQTDTLEAEVYTKCSPEFEQDLFYFPGDQELSVDEEKCDCNCTCDKMKFDGDEFCCPVHLTQSESVLTEILGKCENKCDSCSNQITWDSSWLKVGDVDGRLDKPAIRNIWSGTEVCTTCTNLNPPLTQVQYKLREDISQDGEQLLSDLSSIQKTYMEELPVTEVTCDISELIEMKDCKRRHSLINYEGTMSMQEDCFSFASRLEEDCLMKIATIPTLRSVTL